MQIVLSPCAGLPGAPKTELSVTGDVLTVDGVSYDLSSVPEGGEATPEGGEHPFIGTITRSGGSIACSVRVILDATAASDQPDSPWIVTVTDGAVTVPAARLPQPEPEEPAA